MAVSPATSCISSDMPLTTYRNMTFGRIVETWARELAGTPAEMGREEILHRLIKAFWNGEFELRGETCLTIAPLSGTAADRQAMEENGPPTGSSRIITRRGMIRVLELLGFLPPLAESSEDGDVFSILAALPPSEYGDLARIAYLEALTISKEDFGAWCQSQGHAPPSFWFAGGTAGRRRPPPP